MNAIVAAATQRFFRDGIAAVTMDDIADDAGVTKGAIYHYFRSKDELLAAVIDRSPTQDPGSAMFKALRGTNREKQLRAVGRAGARVDVPREAMALRYELNAAAMRSDVVLEALSRSHRRAMAELVERYGNEVPLPAILVGSAVLEGLQFFRTLNPDAVPASVFEDAIAALGAMLDEA